MPRWEIAGEVGPRARSGTDAHGWLWEIRRGPAGDARRVLVEITRSAWAVDRVALPDDTAKAIDTEGESEVTKLLALDAPPQMILCGTAGCWPREAPTKRV